MNFKIIMSVILVDSFVGETSIFRNEFTTNFPIMLLSRRIIRRKLAFCLVSEQNLGDFQITN